MSKSKELETHALELHRRTIVVDTHCDVVTAFLPFELRPNTPTFRRLFPVKRSLGERSDHGQTDIPRLIEGGVDCEVFNVGRSPAHIALQRLDVTYSEMEKNSDNIAVVTTYDDIIKNKAEGKISAILSNEGADTCKGDLGVLRMTYRLGIRLMGLVWQRRNAVADSHRERTRGGLSNVGVSFIEEMNRLGMIVDVAHLNDPGFWDVLEVSKDPVVDSHACCRELCNKTRNLTDEMIKALAEQDGVIGISFVKGHLSEDAEKANVETVVDHVEHVVNIVGVNHVGIGSDFDGGGLALQDATKMPEITMELVRRGHSDNEVEKILGGNFLRIFKKVWKT